MALKIASGLLVILCALGISAQTNRNGGRLMESAASATPRMSSQSSEGQVKKAIVELDRAYQEAVKNNDAKTMARILSDDFVLVTGKGTTFSKEDLLKEAREGKTIYERQEDSEQTVRVWGDTAVITALLWAKGSSEGKPFEYKLWFSDVTNELRTDGV